VGVDCFWLLRHHLHIVQSLCLSFPGLILPLPCIRSQKWIGWCLSWFLVNFLRLVISIVSYLKHRSALTCQWRDALLWRWFLIHFVLEIPSLLLLAAEINRYLVHLKHVYRFFFIFLQKYGFFFNISLRSLARVLQRWTPWERRSWLREISIQSLGAIIVGVHSKRHAAILVFSVSFIVGTLSEHLKSLH